MDAETEMIHKDLVFRELYAVIKHSGHDPVEALTDI